MVKFIIIILLAFSFVGFADATNTDISSVLNNKPDTIPGLKGDVEDAVNTMAFSIMDGILILAGVVAVFFITVSGVRLTISSGSQDQIDGAKRTLIWAILGLLAIILSWALMSNVVKLFEDADDSGTSSSSSLNSEESGDSYEDIQSRINFNKELMMMT